MRSWINVIARWRRIWYWFAFRFRAYLLSKDLILPHFPPSKDIFARSNSDTKNHQKHSNRSPHAINWWRTRWRFKVLEKTSHRSWGGDLSIVWCIFENDFSAWICSLWSGAFYSHPLNLSSTFSTQATFSFSRTKIHLDLTFIFSIMDCIRSAMTSFDCAMQICGLLFVLDKKRRFKSWAYYWVVIDSAVSNLIARNYTRRFSFRSFVVRANLSIVEIRFYALFDPRKHTRWGGSIPKLCLGLSTPTTSTSCQCIPSVASTFQDQRLFETGSILSRTWYTWHRWEFSIVWSKTSQNTWWRHHHANGEWSCVGYFATTLAGKWVF